MNPQPTITPPQRPGWWKRNWKWFVPVTLVCMLLLGAGVIALIVTLVMGTVKSSTPYTKALAQAKADPAVIAELGTPIEAGWYVTGSVSTSGQNGHADLNIPIYGPNKSGTLHVVAIKSPFVEGMDDWKITKLEVKIDGRSEVIALGGDDTPQPVTLTQDTSDAPEVEGPDVTVEKKLVPKGSGIGQGVPGGVAGGVPDEAPPPPPDASTKNLPTISGGVLNGKAISLPKPAYPAIAKATGAKGAVVVQVLVDENGHVVSATAVSGHPLLRTAAAQAARGARFTPTKLSGQAVRVSGVITYNFTQ